MEGGVVNATPQPLSPRERDRLPIVQAAGWAPGRVWTGAEILQHPGIRSAGLPGRSESLDRLSCFAVHTVLWCNLKKNIRIEDSNRARNCTAQCCKRQQHEVNSLAIGCSALAQ
jgi:hypothetical protein